MEIDLRSFWIWWRLNFNAVLAIIIPTVLLFALTTFLNQAVDAYGLLGGVSLSALAQGQFWRPLTTIFLHASIFHLVFNLFALWDIGGLVERYFGGWKFWLTFLFSALGGVLLSLLGRYVSVYVLQTGGLGDYFGITIGISGGIFGLAGLLFVTNLRRRSNGVPVNTSALAMIILLNLLLGLLLPGVDNLGHVGGLITGALFGLTLLPRGEERWLRWENILPKLGWLCIILVVSAFVLQLWTLVSWLFS